MVKKPTTPKKSTTRSRAKASTKTVMAESVVIEDEAETVVASDDVEVVKSMGKKELIDRVVAASGIKKKDAKPVIEAMLKELGDALSRGENLNLQPFGKGIVKSHKNLENAEVVELRLRRSKIAVTAANVAADVMAEERADDAPDISPAAAE